MDPEEAAMREDMRLVIHTYRHLSDRLGLLEGMHHVFEESFVGKADARGILRECPTTSKRHRRSEHKARVLREYMLRQAKTWEEEFASELAGDAHVGN